MIAHTTTRVPDHSPEAANRQIRRQAGENVRYFAAHPQWIEDRLKELDAEWDIERMLETMSASLSLTGLVLGLTVNKRFLLIPLVVQAFFLQHAIQGWCPPLPVLRQMGFRTAEEIARERYAIKALRGDFREVDTGAREQTRAGQALRAVAR